MRAVSPTPEGAKTTILPKMGTKNRSVSNASRHSSTLAAITQILPENILGVNLSSLGMPPQTAEKMAKDVVDDEAEHAPTGDQRENLPTQLRAGEAAAEEDGGVDRVSEGLAKIATAPDVDNVKFHKIFPAVPSEDRLIESASGCTSWKSVLTSRQPGSALYSGRSSSRARCTSPNTISPSTLQSSASRRPSLFRYPRSLRSRSG